MTYLVTGATGKVGRRVVEHLIATSHPVRVLTRNPAKATGLPDGVEVAAGDLTEPSTLESALTGVVGLHLLTVGGDDYATLRTGPEIVRLAEKAGVRRVTVLWNGSRGPVEEAAASSDLAWTLLQPTDFMGNALGWADSIRTRRSVQEPFGDVAVAVVDESDVGAVAAKVLTEDGHAGETLPITGPEALSPRQRLAVIGEVLGQDLDFDELSEEQARLRWRQAGHSEELIEILAAWQGDPPPAAYTVSPAVRQNLGRPPRGFAEWVLDHAAAFR